MTRRLIFILATLVMAVLRQQALGQATEPNNSIIDFQLQEPLRDYKGWTVGVNQSHTRCFAFAAFQSETAVWLGVGDAGNDFLIAFANRAWSSIENGKAYDLEVVYNRKNWRGTFSGFTFGDSMGMVARGLSEDFVVDFDRSPGFEIRYQGKSIGRLSLEGSKAALGAAISCAQDLTKHEDPFAASGAQADPFAAQPPTVGDFSLVGTPEVTLGFGPDMPKIGNKWSLGVEEAGVVEAAITSTDQSLVLRFMPSRKESFFPVTCKYSIALYSANEKPGQETMAGWSASRVAGTDRQGMVELKLAGNPIRIFTEPDDYYGGRSFEYDFNPGQVKATLIEAVAPLAPKIKPARFEFSSFETVLNYLCASTQTTRPDGENVLSPEATSRSGPLRGRCRMEVCDWSVLRSKTVLWADGRGGLLKVEVFAGESKHAAEDGYPNEFSDKVRVSWDSKPHEYFVFCSKSFPSVLWPIANGKYLVQRPDYKNLSSTFESSAIAYAEDCHRVALYTELSPNDFADQFGYQPAAPNEVELANPYEVFDLAK